MRLHRGDWHIFRAQNVRSDCEYQYGDALGTPVFPYNQREEAIKLMCKLNGWKYYGDE